MTALVVFWCLLIAGWVVGALDRRRSALFVGLWLGAFVLLGALGYGTFVPTVVALLDVVLVLVIFEGDVRLR